MKRRRKGESLIQWLERVRIQLLEEREYCEALWMSDLISNIKRLETEAGEIL